jgi:hypothetical protein
MNDDDAKRKEASELAAVIDANTKVIEVRSTCF